MIKLIIQQKLNIFWGRFQAMCNNMKTRHRDKFQSLESFNNPCFVVCPKCSGCAVISIALGEENRWFSKRNLVCLNCTYRDVWSSNAISRLWCEAKDDYFNLPLWLQVPCGENTLFAYNTEHLKFLESFVGAKLRERKRDPKFGWSNRSAVSRLPEWIQSRKKREVVLKGIKKLWLRADVTHSTL